MNNNMNNKKILYKKTDVDAKISERSAPFNQARSGSALDIFYKYSNKNYKLIPLNDRKFEQGQVKYFPPLSKEWKNSIYSFNFNNLKNFPVYDININYLIKSYFNSHFYAKFINAKFKSRRNRRLSMNRIFISKAEIKHTNSKALITLYTYNREKKSLLKKIKFLKKLNFLRNTILKKLKFFRNTKLKPIWYKLSNPLIHTHTHTHTHTLRQFIFLINKNNIYLRSLSYISSRKIYKRIVSRIKNRFFKGLKLFRKYKLRFNFNKHKFEENLLYILSSLISKYYNKKVEFNIVNMRSIIFNSDLFTYILTLKIKKKRAKIMRLINFILNKAKLPKVNRIIEKGSRVNKVNFNLLENKYLNTNLDFILNEGASWAQARPKLRRKLYNLDELLNEGYYNVSSDENENENENYNKIYETIFNSIKYKNMGGVRLEVRGRLTRRYRADRSVYKVKWKGGLNNIDASHKGLSTVNKLGYLKPNVEYSIFTSKRRVGAFAVKGWVNGK